MSRRKLSVLVSETDVVKVAHGYKLMGRRDTSQAIGEIRVEKHLLCVFRSKGNRVSCSPSTPSPRPSFSHLSSSPLIYNHLSYPLQRRNRDKIIYIRGCNTCANVQNASLGFDIRYDMADPPWEPATDVARHLYLFCAPLSIMAIYFPRRLTCSEGFSLPV